MNNQQFLDMRTDMKLLLECLDYQKDNPSAMKQALVTLASSLQSCGESKDEFRECGGLQQVLEIVTHTKSAELTEAGLFCLGSAVESNVYSQKLLSTASVFTFLHGVLSEQRTGAARKKQTASFLLLCLVSNNGFGQNLIRQSSCLHDIITLIRTTLPKNSRGHSEWLEGIDGISVELWSTLVSTACVCVNNPQNEENQRICSSMFPYLFSLLQHHTDERIVKPTLSLLGLTVSNNVQNQDRIRKCGGMDILVKRLESLQKCLDEDSKKLATVIQLLNTLDSCITDNEANSQRFGALGGVKLVIKILSGCPLSDHDKIQTVLTLAHAVDSCRSNQKFITESDGMTVLIQQLTVTEDLELSKTIKYLLHICVASGKPGDEETGDELSDAEKLSKAEQLKRHSELAILKKINELDSKLKTIAKGNLTKNGDEEDTSHDQDTVVISELMSPQSEAHIPSALAKSTCGSYHGDHMCHQATPREQTLIDQLVQEKVERQKLELLNKMLQENMLMKNMLLSRKTDAVPNEGHETIRHDRPSCSNQNTYESDRNNSATTRSGKSYSPGAHITEPCIQPVQNKSLNKSMHMEVENLTIRTRNRTAGKDSTENQYQNSEPYDLRKNSTSNKGSTNKAATTDSVQTSILDVTGTSQNIPLNLSARSKDTDLKYNEVLDLSQRSPGEKFKMSGIRGRSATIRHAEIQCGTPYVANIENETEIVPADKVITTKDKAYRTERKHQVNGSSGTDMSHLNTSSISKAQQTNQSQKFGENDKFVAVKTPLVVLSDIYRNKNLKNNSCAKNPTTNISSSKEPSAEKQENTAEDPTSGPSNDIDRVSRSSSDKFVKPIAIPPRSKLRVTPRLGLGVAPSTSTFVKPAVPVGSTSPSNASICSEFDRDLICKLQNKAAVVIRNPPRAPPSVRPQKRTYVTPVIKSQNNVRKLDKHLAENQQNAAESWNAVPSTPKQQGIPPPRPAFSDCGMRRPVLDSPYSVMSVGRLNNVDDSGFDSPDLRNVNSDTSSIDSNIEGFRSDSDPSDGENEQVIITTVALRSSGRPVRRSARKRVKISSEKCPETNPNTCTYHRQVRRIERAHIQEVKKGLNQRHDKRLMEKTIKKRPALKRKKEKKSVYEFTSDSTEDYISPSVASDNEPETFLCLPQRAKLRRRRIPYTDEEEFNLLEGVKKLGKHWNQILLTYKFHLSRTNVDLKDKYKRLMAENKDTSTARGTSKGTLTVMPFSMCEERRLHRGVKRCGYNWKNILQSFTFAKGRTTEDLRNKWRSLHRRKPGKDQ